MTATALSEMPVVSGRLTVRVGREGPRRGRFKRVDVLFVTDGEVFGKQLRLEATRCISDIELRDMYHAIAGYSIFVNAMEELAAHAEKSGWRIRDIEDIKGRNLNPVGRWLGEQLSSKIRVGEWRQYPEKII